LASAGVACGIVRSLAEVAADPEARREMIVETVSPEGKPIEVMGNPMKLGSSPVTVRQAPPALGQDNEYVYCQLLGHSPAEVEGWRQQGII
jgi:crotonobetainyl-CoA:carnitine CoA-transferase CaiB-like acyl-CoA transferase